VFVSPKEEFDSVVEMHGEEIFAYLWRLLSGREDAEDCLQEVFVRAFKAFDRLHEGSNVRAWLYKIATNTAIRFRDKRVRREAKEYLMDHDFISIEPSPLDQVLSKEQLVSILKVVESLPAKQRAAVIMRKYQECSYDEIAIILECSQESARANVYQGVKKIRAKFLNSGWHWS
jgi:RNA polymerase sigma-70 factor (ECF subfamily)